MSENFRSHNSNASCLHFLSSTWLAVAGLSSSTVRFATILRDPAKSDLATSSDSILDITFQNVMDSFVVGLVIMALVSGLSSIFVIILVIYPKWLQENCTVQFSYRCIQVVVSKIVLSLGGYVANHAHGLQTFFEFIDSDGHFPYYTIMYYGAVG
ncbi:unnamed protein product [Penicillium salamii]|nr:unnamed protein product [Penicillium salamii]